MKFDLLRSMHLGISCFVFRFDHWHKANSIFILRNVICDSDLKSLILMITSVHTLLKSNDISGVDWVTKEKSVKRKSMFKECRPKAIERERGNTRGSDKNTHIHNTHASFVQRRRLLYSISDIVIFDVAFIDNSDARRKKQKIIIETYLLSRCHTFEIY